MRVSLSKSVTWLTSKLYQLNYESLSAMFYDVPKCFSQYLMILHGADFYDRLPDVQFCEGLTIISAYIYIFLYI